MSGPVLVVSPDTAGPAMAGPAIRAVELARALARRGLAVRLAVPPPAPVQDIDLPLVDAGQSKELVAAVDDAASVIIQGDVLVRYPLLRRARTLVVDLYDPFLFESLRQQLERPAPLRAAWQDAVMALLVELLERGDFFLCASERQRDLWLGMLASLGRANPAAYATDSRLRHLLEVVPFGIPDPPPPSTAGPPAGWPFAPGDPVVLWAGGVWDWLDPLTLIRAVARLRPELPRLRLLFAGTSRPNPAAAAGTAMLRRAVALSDELGLTGSAVVFHRWVPYAERHAWLRQAAVGAVLDQPTPETRFAYRTRVLDHIWAGLPTLISAGSTTAELIAEHGLGAVVPEGDVDAAAAALRRLLLAPPPAEAFATVRESLRWDRVVEPLARFCAAPYRTRSPVQPMVRAGASAPPWQLARFGWLMLRRDGLAATLRAARTYLRLQRAGYTASRHSSGS